MSEVHTVAESMLPRVQAMMQSISEALGPEQSGTWADYHASEPLTAYLMSNDSAMYKRAEVTDLDGQIARNSIVELTDLKPIAIDSIDWGEPEVIDSEVVETATNVVRNPTKVSADEKVTYSFSKLTSLKETATVGLELAVKTKFGSDASVANLEIEGKVSSSYEHESFDSSEASNVVERTVSVPPFTSVRWEAKRTRSTYRRQITAPLAFDSKIKIYQTTRFFHGDQPQEQWQISYDSWSQWFDVLVVWLLSYIRRRLITC